MSKWTPKSLSQALFCILNVTYFLFFSRELTSKWHLTEFFSLRLSSNHLSISFEDFSKEAIKSSILPETAYGVEWVTSA